VRLVIPFLTRLPVAGVLPEFSVSTPLAYLLSVSLGSTIHPGVRPATLTGLCGLPQSCKPCAAAGLKSRNNGSQCVQTVYIDACHRNKGTEERRGDAETRGRRDTETLR